MTEQTVLLRRERKPEAEQIAEFASELNPMEQKAMLDFIQGIRWAKGLERKNAGETARTA